MLTLNFSAQDLARTRFAFSPLQEVATSIQSLKDPGSHALHSGWARDARQRLAAADARYELLNALVPIPAVYIPDFLTPIPEAEYGDIETELAVLQATDAEAVRLDLDRIPRRIPGRTGSRFPDPVQDLYRDPAGGLARLADEIRTFWALAIQPHWSRIKRLLEGEILHRAQMMARGGAAELFQNLHPQVSWQGGTLRVAHAHYHRDRALDGGLGLVLLPSVFVWPGVFSQSRPPHQPGLVYPARGIATLWERGQARTPEALANVLGHTRAHLLMELASPASTTELAARMDMPAPTVSHHLTALRAAGLAASHRSGRVVLYLRTRTAEALVQGDPDSGVG
jgi:hypothetical protein